MARMAPSPRCGRSAPGTARPASSPRSRLPSTPPRRATGSSSRPVTTRSAPTTPPTRPPPHPRAGVWIDKPNLHLLGLDRNGVVVDGTRSGPTCSSAAADQDRGPTGPGGAWGRNGIEVFEASGVTIQNLTACNFLSGQDGSGNQIWWNGGYETAQIHMHAYSGSYLSATTSLLPAERPSPGDLRNLRRQLRWARAHRPHLRQQHERLWLLHRGLPGLQRGARSRPRREQRARLLGHQLRRPPRHQQRRVGQQRRGDRHQQREQW